MMAKRHTNRPLLQRLPSVQGRYRCDISLAPMNWFRVGGRAEILFEPADPDDLALFLRQCDPEIPRTILGAGSNCLIRDGGLPGVTIKLRQGFSQIQAGAGSLTVGAGALDFTVARRAARAGLAGLEFLIGVPGAIGGALKMNAGAYGREMKDVVQHAWALDREGREHRVEVADFHYRYRHSDTPDDWIFVAATLTGSPAEAAAVTATMDGFAANRSATQPILERTGGSSFKNPPGAKAWQLIDQAGCRGLRHGGAMISAQHCNFLINTGGATAQDIETLGEEVRRRVFAETGTMLEWEIQRIGIPSETPFRIERGRNA